MTFKSTLLAATAAVVVAGTAFGMSPAAAADFGCRTAKLIVPWGAGGGTDVIFRQFVEAVNEAGAEPELQVVNIGGQGGNKGAKEAAKAKPDGCTLFAIHQSALTSYFTGRIDFTWDKFEPVAMLTRTPSIFGANADVPYQNITEMVAYAKENPGKINAGGTLGSTSQFVYLLLEDAAGIKFNHVSYDGTRQRMTALLAGNIDTGEINLAAAKKYIQTGELKALGITTEERNSEIPDVATLKEQGYDLVYGVDRGVMLPEGTSQEIIDHYAGLFKQAAENPKVVEAMNAKGTYVNYMNPAESETYWSETQAKWSKIAKDVGIYKAKD
ncbi:Bug family tripartite tricarboxylate transporter substrate binding protein [Thalassobaculum litoreum]|uniref:Tripartite-type tricarboxylate transporter, receptor component TctC n=1 Tax=Thalassobaculum litoreum DSM 18839 TaxID=1123362 RepID=A0A8G2BLW5_9PROT|nr:tripartite tricarboxylate transporter substrate binding protein [Thalassobaculum litoreum]SDG46231.1 Tripartite-type tricarboxylate transporter, receptor component TctC [Thalassobaculum litoreum DSM 18839]